MGLLGFAVCAPDPTLRTQLPCVACDIDRAAIPALLRRRTSRATQMAFSAALAACRHAGRDPAALPAVFASVAGELQTTDQLCIELSKPDGVVSPNAFHNSVHNTAAGYWSIAQQCTYPATALAAGDDTFAMGLLEAWCQLACHGGELLLVCYEEIWPGHLGCGRGTVDFSCALVLSAGVAANAIMRIGQPYRNADGIGLPPNKTPVMAALPLLQLAADGGDARCVALSPGRPTWQVEAMPLSANINASPHQGTV